MKSNRGHFPIHLQWFASEESAGDDGTTIASETDAPAISADASEDDYEVVISNEKEPDEKTTAELEALKTQVATLTAQNTELLKRADGTSAMADRLSEGFDKLGQRLSPSPVAGQAAKPAEPELSDEDFDVKFMDKPSLYLDKRLGKHLQSLKPQLEQLLLNNKVYSRNFATLDASCKLYLDLYGPEIEQTVAAMPVEQQMKDPDIYRKAVKVVIAEHIDEIVQKQTEAAVAAAQAQIKKNQPARPVSFNETASRPVQGPRRIKLTAEEAAMCERRGIDPRTYEEYKNGK